MKSAKDFLIKISGKQYSSGVVVCQTAELAMEEFAVEREKQEAIEFAYYLAKQNSPLITDDLKDYYMGIISSDYHRWKDDRNCPVPYPLFIGTLTMLA